MRIWITGGAGFLGRCLAVALANPNSHILSLSRRHCSVANESVSIDLARDKKKLRGIVGDHGPPDLVIHTASRQPGNYSFADYFSSNVTATVNLLDALRESPPRQIIYTSTLSVYARSERLPFQEDRPASASIPYAATKRWAEELLEVFKDSQIIVLRLPSLYGKGQQDSFIDGLAQLALRDEEIELFGQGKVIRDALHASDVTNAIAATVSRPPDKRFCLMNLGTGRPIQTNTYAEALIEALGSKSRIVLSERATSHFDCYAAIDTARRLIGFQPTELKESMRRYADELRA